MIPKKLCPFLYVTQIERVIHRSKLIDSQWSVEIKTYKRTVQKGNMHPFYSKNMFTVLMIQFIIKFYPQVTIFN